MAAIRGARATISPHVPRASRLPDRKSSEARIGPGRSLDRPHQSLSLNGLDRPPVLVGQPVRPQVEVDPYRRNGAVSGLGLNSLDGHTRLPQPGEAGVAQLVTGPVVETGPSPCGPHDLVESRNRERMPPINASISSGSRILGSRRTPRTRGRPRPDRDRLWRVAMPRAPGSPPRRHRHG